MTDEAGPDDEGQPETPPPPPPGSTAEPAARPDGRRFVVPDPDGPPGGEATTFVAPATPPPTPPPAPPQGWQPPPTTQGPPATTPPAAQPPQPGPPANPTGPPTAPPTAPGQGVPVGGWVPPPAPGAPPQGTPVGGPAPQQWGAPQPPPNGSTGSGRAGKVVLAIVIVLLAAIGAFFGVRALLDDGSNLDGTIGECRIETDGALTATGSVSSNEEFDTTLEVRFDDAENGTEVDRTTVDVRGGAGETVEWTAEGQAGDEVNRVTCVLGPLD